MTGQARVSKLLIPWDLHEMGPRAPTLPASAERIAPTPAPFDYAAESAANDDDGREPSS